MAARSWTENAAVFPLSAGGTGEEAIWPKGLPT